MKAIAAFTVSVTLLMGQSDKPSSRSAARAVVAVRHWSLSDATRVAIEVNGPFEFRTDRLHNPERVYFDIPNTRPHIDAKRSYGEDVNDKLLQRIRVAETTHDITRVVLDLAANVDVTTSKLTNPQRLIVELRMGGATGIPPEAPVTDPSARPVGPKPPVSAPGAGKPAPAPAPAPTKTPAKTQVARTEDRAPGVAPDPRTPPEDAAADSPVPPAAAAPPEEVGKAARHTSAGTNSLIRTLGLKINRVVIDPGHGGHDNGTEGAKGLVEKELVLDVALRVGQLVEDRMGAEVIYTRTDDTFVPLEGRTALANEKKADLFLSIHANSSPIPQIAGVETFYLNINGSKDAMDVAARENASAQKSIFELQDLIRKITLHDKSEESHEFAKRVQASLYSLTSKNFPAAKDRGVKTAPFVVLIGANMPSVLAEIGFVSNSKEEVLLKKSDYRQKVAEAVYKGMEKYTESLSHFQVAASR
jgi:N-acetylmuramoyl-L-alanine amidase